ncbi:regulator of (H+)-ATPase in vacuolar membrane [Cryptotrichosporon argae]
MALRLRQAVPGRPRASTQPLASVCTDQEACFAYPSSSNVVLVSPDGELRQTLPLWDAVSYRGSNARDVDGVCASDGWIVAWSGAQVVLWHSADVKAARTWAVHSTLVIGAPVTCLDYRAGMLALGTQAGLEMWRVDPQASVVVWDRVWCRSYAAPTTVRVSPQLSHVAWTRSDCVVYIQSVNLKADAVGVLQEIRQPRDVSWIGWRNSPSSDPQLYIVSRDVLRLYAPVLDDPAWFQLLLTLDTAAFRRGEGKGKAKDAEPGTIWVPDAETMRAARTATGSGDGAGDGEEAGDVVCWTGNGQLVVRSIMNLDRKPPTLLRSVAVASFPASGSRITLLSSIIFDASTSTLHVGTVTASGLSTGVLVFPPASATLAPPTLDVGDELAPVQLSAPLSSFVRTPNGRGLLAIGADGEMAVYEKRQLGKLPAQKKVRALIGKGHWQLARPPNEATIFAKGRAVVAYSAGGHAAADAGGQVTLQHLDGVSLGPSEPVIMPHFEPAEGETVEMLLAMSDVDDGHSRAGRKTTKAVVIACTGGGEAWVWRIDSPSDLSDTATPGQGTPAVPTVSLVSRARLPVDTSLGPLRLVLPVDPMGWHQSAVDWTTDSPLQDMVLTVSDGGVLEFWRPRLGAHTAGTATPMINQAAACGHHDVDSRAESWARSGVVYTGKKKALMARCSSRKKTALICETDNGVHEMTIWDSNVSEFSTGLELTHVFPMGEKVQDLDWTTTSDLQSVLAVGFRNKVVLICEQRMSYVEALPGWAAFLTIDMERYTPVPIVDSIWLAGGSLAVGCGNQTYVFSRFLDRPTPVPSPAASARGVLLDPEEPEDIFQLIAQQNGPLIDYHPTVLAQCLLWNKIELVKRIIRQLVASLRTCEDEGKRWLVYPRLQPLEFHSTAASQPAKSIEQQRRSLDTCGLRYLISLRMFANRDRRGGASGAATPAAHSGTQTPATTLTSTGAGLHRDRLAFRNIVWATHSESHEVLMQAATASCREGKMLWADAKRLGIFLWLSSTDAIKAQLEIIARNRFMQDEDRDPTCCSLIFFALGKKHVVHGLWRQAPGHKEQALMTKFLANDFATERWRTAAAKNAYALLSKQRYEYAAAFFMLAGAHRDALTVCLRQLDDWQLAVALARAVEGRADGPLLHWVLEDAVLPRAFAGGHRWLASWAFWTLKRRDLAVRVLIAPMTDVASAWAPLGPPAAGSPENDDPSLLLLFQHLKARSLQTARGTAEIPAKVEYDFVLHNARVFCRMGCHALALDLVRSWSFERPLFAPQARALPVPTPLPHAAKAGTPAAGTRATPTPTRPPRPAALASSPARARRHSFILAPARGGRSVILDVDLTEDGTEPPTRAASPRERADPNTLDGVEGGPGGRAGAVDQARTEPEAGVDGEAGKGGTPDERHAKHLDHVSRPGRNTTSTPAPAPAPEPPRKIGNLMKELRQDVAQGAMEFDMDSFF